MPIDLDRAVGAPLPTTTYTWTEEDLILYNLGVGAGDPPDDPAELKYTYEQGLVAVPSFGTIPPFLMMMGIGGVGGLDIDLARVLHGDQTLTVHRPIPTSGSVTQEGSITGIFDKGRGALIVLEMVSKLDSGEKLFTNRAGIFARGEGGFGGDPGPSTRRHTPERPPDFTVASATLPQQALLYRMASGDKNPLHADPAFAALGGFERPILHGLCTYGIVCRAVVESGFDGNPARVDTYSARFTGHVFPGETLVTSIWVEDAGHVIESKAMERDSRVLIGVVAERPI